MSSHISWTQLYYAILQNSVDTVREACYYIGWRIHVLPLSQGRTALMVAAFLQNDEIQEILLDDLLTYKGPLALKFRKKLLKKFVVRLNRLPENCYLCCNIQEVLEGILSKDIFQEYSTLFLNDSRALRVWMEYVRDKFEEVEQEVEIRNIIIQSFIRGLRAIFYQDDWVTQHPTFQITLDEIPQHLQVIFRGSLDSLESVLAVMPNWQNEKFQFIDISHSTFRTTPPIEDSYICDPISAFDLAILADDDEILAHLIAKSGPNFTKEILENLLDRCAYLSSRKCLEHLFSLQIVDSSWQTKWSSVIQTALKRQNFEIAIRILDFLTPPYQAEYYYLWKFMENVSGFSKADSELIKFVWRRSDEYRILTKDSNYAKTFQQTSNMDRSLFAIEKGRVDMLEAVEGLFGQPNFKNNGANYYSIFTSTAPQSLVIFEKFADQTVKNPWDTERLLKFLGDHDLPIARVILEDTAMTRALYPMKVLDICLVKGNRFELALELMDLIDTESFTKFANDPSRISPNYLNELNTYIQLLLRCSPSEGTKVEFAKIDEILRKSTEDEQQLFKDLVVESGIDVSLPLFEAFSATSLAETTSLIQGIRCERNEKLSLRKLSRLAVRRSIKSRPFRSLHDSLIALGLEAALPEAIGLVNSTVIDGTLPAILLDYLMFKDVERLKQSFYVL